MWGIHGKVDLPVEILDGDDSQHDTDPGGAIYGPSTPTNSLLFFMKGSGEDDNKLTPINFASNPNGSTAQNSMANLFRLQVTSDINISKHDDSGDDIHPIVVEVDADTLYILNTSVKGYVSKLVSSSSHTVHTYTAQVDEIVTVSIAAHGSDSSAYFKKNIKYFWKISFLYDGYQESQLSSAFSQTVDTSGDSTNAVNDMNVTITLKNIATSLPKRASHVNLYRADGASDVPAASNPEGYYRLVGSYELNNAWSDSSNDKTLLIQDTGTVTASYEARTGLPETIYDLTPKYSMSAQLNNQLFVGGCIHSGIDDASNYIFKSMPYNFDQFDWTKDILRLPTTPTALVSFNGRIYAFDNNNTYRIEPNNFYIEDIFEGVGCSSKNSVIVTEYGMFIADKNNIYMHNGQNPTAIATPILTSSNNNNGDSPRNFSWLDNDSSCIDKSYSPKLAFDSSRKALIVMFKSTHNLTIDGTTYQYFSWVYTMTSNRWDLWTLNTKQPLSTVPGKNGEVLVSTDNKLVNYAGDTSLRKQYIWESKEFTMGADTQNKRFNNFLIAGSPSGTIGTNVYVELDGASSDESGSVSEFKISSKKGKKVKMFLKDQTGKVDSIGTVFRRLRVK